MIAAWMGQRHLIMADDPIVKVGHVHRAVRPQLQIDWTKPWIVTAQEVGLLFGNAGRAMVFKPVAVDPAGHDVSNEHIALKLRRKILTGVEDNSSDRG